MTDAMAADEAGNELTAFHRVAERAMFPDAPTPLALVAAWHLDGCSWSSIASVTAGSCPAA